MGVFRNFPYSNFHEMNMDEMIKIIKNMLEEWAQYHAEWDAWMTEINEDWSNYQDVMNEAWQNMQNFINNYFDNLDVQEEINNKITSMVNSGEFATIVDPYIPPRVSAWLSEHITQPVGVVIDTSLTVAGACADAKATGDRIEYLENHVEKIDNVLEMPMDDSYTGTSTSSWTSVALGAYDLKKDIEYTFNFSIPSAVGNTIYLYVKDELNNNIITAQLLGTDTSIERTYTPTNDETVYASFQIGVATTTVVTCHVTEATNNKIEQITDDITSLTDLLTTTEIITRKIDPISGVTGKKVFYNVDYNLLTLGDDATVNVHVYKVSSGDVCRIYGRGNNTQAQPIAAVGNADIITSGAVNCKLLQGIVAPSAVIGGYTVEATITDSGYLYVNYGNNVDIVIRSGNELVVRTDATLTDPALPANAKAVGEAIGIKGVLKNNDAYTVIGNKGNETIGLTFQPIGGNQLTDWDIWSYGVLSGDIFAANDTIFDAYTDITGPFSIGRNLADGGQWAGGYHTKTINDVACPTAEQTDIAVYVDGTNITSEENGFYSGEVVIETTNIIYFPQTIIDNIFTDAVQAIEEKRRYSFENNDVHVQVIAKTLESVYFALYYGMQMQSAWADEFIIPSDNIVLADSDIISDMNFAETGHIIINKSSNARLEMRLDNNGIGTFKYNNGDKIHLMSNGNKSYFVQIRNLTIPANTYLYWNGVYKISRT